MRFPARPAWLGSGVAASVLVALAAVLHGVHVQAGALAQNVAVVLKVVMIVGFLLFAASVALTNGMAPATAVPTPFSVTVFAGSVNHTVLISLRGTIVGLTPIGDQRP